MKPGLRTQAVFAKATIKTLGRILLGLLNLIPRVFTSKLNGEALGTRLCADLSLWNKRKYTLNLLKINLTKAFPQARGYSH